MPEEIAEQPQVQPEAPACHKSPLMWVIISIVLLIIIAAGAIGGYLYWPECEQGECEEVVEDVVINEIDDELVEGEAYVTAPIEGYDFISTPMHNWYLSEGIDEYYESCTFFNELNGTESYWVPFEEINNEITITAIDEAVGPVVYLSDMIDDLEYESSRRDEYYWIEICDAGGTIFVTGTSDHSTLDIYEWLVENESRNLYQYESIPNLLDFIYKLIPFSYNGDTVVRTGYGDAGYVSWKFYTLDPVSYASDLVEKCSGGYEMSTGDFSEDFEYSCSRINQ